MPEDKKPEIFYYHQEGTEIVWWADKMINTNDFIYLGSSTNPNKKMALAMFTKGFPARDGWRLREYPY